MEASENGSRLGICLKKGGYERLQKVGDVEMGVAKD